MIIKRTIKFTLKKQQKASSRVIMRVTYGGKRFEFQTGIVIREDFWDGNKEQVKASYTSDRLSSDLNDYLSFLKVRMTTVFHQYELMGKVPDKDELRSSFNSKNETKVVHKVENNLKPSGDKVAANAVKTEVKVVASTKKASKKNSFFDSFDEFVKINGKLNDWTKSTYQKFAALRHHLSSFKKNVTFDTFDENGIADFVDYLAKDRNMKNSTINKQLGFLRWVLRWCYQKGYNKNHTFEYFKPKLKAPKKKVIFLNQEELQRIEEFEIPENHEALGPVRDVFLFCCYTGLRYSDVKNLTWEDVHNGRMEVVTIKTNDRLIIELNKKAYALMSKYEEVHFKGNVVFPVIANQNMNSSLHLLFKLAGFNDPVKIVYYQGNERKEEVIPKYELISTHAGRRTFICMALSKGIPPSVVMKWTGHSDYKAMKPYIDIADDVKEEYMKKFDDE
jgi:integrase